MDDLINSGEITIICFDNNYADNVKEDILDYFDKNRASIRLQIGARENESGLRLDIRGHTKPAAETNGSDRFKREDAATIGLAELPTSSYAAQGLDAATALCRPIFFCENTLNQQVNNIEKFAMHFKTIMIKPLRS